MAREKRRLQRAREALWARTPRRAPVTRRPTRAPHVRLLRLRFDLVRWLRDGRLATPERPTFLALHRTARGVEAHRLDPQDFEALRRANGRTHEATLVEAVAAACDVWNREAQRSLREMRRVGLLCPDR